MKYKSIWYLLFFVFFYNVDMQASNLFRRKKSTEVPTATMLINEGMIVVEPEQAEQFIQELQRTIQSLNHQVIRSEADRVEAERKEFKLSDEVAALKQNVATWQARDAQWQTAYTALDNKYKQQSKNYSDSTAQSDKNQQLRMVASFGVGVAATLLISRMLAKKN